MRNYLKNFKKLKIFCITQKDLIYRAEVDTFLLPQEMRYILILAVDAERRQCNKNI